MTPQEHYQAAEQLLEKASQMGAELPEHASDRTTNRTVAAAHVGVTAALAHATLAGIGLQVDLAHTAVWETWRDTIRPGEDR